MTASQEPATTSHVPSRRTVVSAVGAAGIAAALTACGGSDEDTSQPAGNASSGSESSGSESSGNASSGSGDKGKEIAKTSDIPEGGGKVLADAGMVVTQPKPGEFKAFTNVCTHQGCKVNKVAGGSIDCPCHGSKFSIEDGSVSHPPATKPLEEKQIKVSGDSITLA
ncbi:MULTISPECIES: Rieske (2Fe-2S) protein [unclassified Streptomyces]|uniref:Rieske (2Fe-2S) protein n=1 Tax=unclassified Streptomyces TaxID=2593676 RepID=UPI00278C7E07|nr:MULTISPECIES: Rieske (2Fe-2S) protein [unclassified Streptomyces]